MVNDLDHLSGGRRALGLEGWDAASVRSVCLLYAQGRRLSRIY